MTKYEALFVFATETADEVRENLLKKFTSIIESEQGTIEGTDKWGVKKLAYPIKYKRDGYFVLVSFSAPNTTVRKITELANITESLLRCLVTKK